MPAAILAMLYGTRRISTWTGLPASTVSSAQAACGSPSLGLPTLPSLMKSTSSISRTHGLWVCPKTRTSVSAPCAMRARERGSRSSNRYSFIRRGEPCTRRKRLPSASKRIFGRSAIAMQIREDGSAGRHDTLLPLITVAGAGPDTGAYPSQGQEGHECRDVAPAQALYRLADARVEHEGRQPAVPALLL